MTPERLRGLVALAEARAARDLARLERLAAEDRALADAIEALGRLHARDMAEAADAPLALLGRRLVWADAEMARARATRRRLADEIAAARAAAITSLGKRRALERLHETAARAARAAAESRAERNAPSARGAVDDL